MNTFFAAAPAPGQETGEPAPSTACFSLTCAADPGAMPRVLELFAKRGLVPDSWISRRIGPDELSIDLQMEGLLWETADLMAQQMRQMISVHTVLISRRHLAGGVADGVAGGLAGRVVGRVVGGTGRA
jgi:hypothetical protein